MTDEAAGAAKGREVSTISFPYTDLDDAIKVIRTMHSVGGGVPMERDQVSAALNNTGGSFANRLSAAKQFGLLESAQGKWALAPLAYAMLDEQTEARAKCEAFLNVELYKRTFDEYRGKTLPGKIGLEHAFTTFGVAQKQKEKARQTFERSARTAGFFPSASEDRLVQPVVAAPKPDMSEPEAESPKPLTAVMTGAVHAAAYANTVPDMHPFVVGLLSELPQAKSEWSKDDRAKWLQAAAQIFDLLYVDDAGRATVIEVKTTQRS